jgi:hypothetical protein
MKAPAFVRHEGGRPIMNVGAVRTLIIQRRGVVLAIVVLLLGVLAALLAVNVLAQARQLAAGEAPATSSATPTVAPTAEPRTPEPTVTPEPARTATPEPTPVPTPVPTPEGITGWALAGAFGSSEAPTGVLDITRWRGAIVAVGTSWQDDNPVPRMWRSADGQSWSESPLDLGPDASLQVVTELPDGRLLILGTIGDDVAYWSDQSRAAAWTSTDGVTWTVSDVPFGTSQYGPLEFAAGARGLVATNGEEIWHSIDGSAWTLAYEAPRGMWVYGPVAGDEGWIVKLASASLGTTTLLVSGDATTWYDVDLGNVATVANVAGDWLVTRASEDWSRTEVLRSADGLDWKVIVDLSQLPPPEGTEVTANGARLTGTGEVLLMSPWEGGHCGAMPSAGWGAWWSVDGIGWASAGIGGDAVVTHAVDIGEDTVLAGYTDGSGEIGFWISTP